MRYRWHGRTPGFAVCVLWLVAGVLLLADAPVVAGEESAADGGERPPPPVVEAVYVEEPPTIDGQLDDACWAKAARLEGLFCPDLDQPVPEETIGLICVDEEAIYVGFLCHDRTPGDIVANETRRNGDIWNDDWASFDLDTWHTHGGTYTFIVTARGTQQEAIPGGSATKIEWRGDWTAAACRTTEGWQAEMAIPFSILRYSPGQDIFGFTIGRHFAEERVWACYPIMGKTWDPTRTADLKGLRPPTIKPRPMLMPYVTADLGESVGRRFDTGLDVQHRMPSGLTALATFNPDFSQIEDVVEPISFSYTERYLDDPRPFFATGQEEYLPRYHLLYTRRIEDFDAGIKVFGTVGDETIGILDAITLGDENALAGAWGHRFDDDAYSKLVFVSHRRAGEPSSFCYGLDASHAWRRPEGVDSLWIVLYESQTQGAESGGSYAIGGDGRRTRGSRNSDYGWMLRAVTEDFAPSLGYWPWTDQIGGYAYFSQQDNFETGPLQVRGWSMWIQHFPYLEADGMYWSEMTPGYSWNWRNGRSAHLGLTMGRREGYSSSDASLYYGWNGRDMYRRGGASVLRGERRGGRYTYYSLGQSFRPLNGLSLRLDGAYSDLAEPAAYAGHQYQTVLTASYDVTPEKCVAARGIWRDAGFTAYASYRQVVRRGMDAYVIVGDPDPAKSGFTERLAV